MPFQLLKDGLGNDGVWTKTTNLVEMQDLLDAKEVLCRYKEREDGSGHGRISVRGREDPVLGRATTTVVASSTGLHLRRGSRQLQPSFSTGRQRA